MIEQKAARFPGLRLRRLRRTQPLRRMVQEARLHVEELVYPVFVVPGRGQRQPIDSMPGISRFSADTLLDEAAAARDLGIPALILFGLPSHKDEMGTEAYDPEGVTQQAIHALKQAFPDLLVMADVCLCEYTSHGHCGVVVDGEVDNDRSLELLAATALSLAQAGADVVAPSAMMDGQVAAIRQRLDGAGLTSTPVMAYAAKYSSSFYGPFREAADSAPGFGDRRSYQMDPANAREALREVELDAAEGADILMVKPALPYLDIISRVRAAFSHPLAAYNVSGEYSMLQSAIQRGWLEERRAIMETLTSIKRAGADIILTYHAREVARWLKEG